MKIFVFLFSFYLAALSAVPCSDKYNANESDKTSSSISQSHSNHTDHSDQCSPFCICNCCNTSVVLKYTLFNFKESKLSILSEVKFPTSNTSPFSSYTGNIWHPPQLTV